MHTTYTSHHLDADEPIASLVSDRGISLTVNRGESPALTLYLPHENGHQRNADFLQRVADELHTMAVECDRRGDAERRSA